jgi:flagellar motor switch protein FliN/FliY
LWIAAPEQAWQTLASWVFDAAGLGAAEPDDARKTYFEILSQSLGSTVQWLSSHLGLQVTLAEGGVVESTDPAASRFSVEFSGAAAGPLFLAISDRLLDGFTPQPGSTTAAHPNPTALAVLGDLPSGPRTLDLLLDVELPVSVSFGRSRLPVKDVLKLVTGSVIELNRTINEPVEVLVNHCIVARGEVVVVDGNYGVRITQIVSRQDRLRSAEC